MLQDHDHSKLLPGANVMTHRLTKKNLDHAQWQVIPCNLKTKEQAEKEHEEKKKKAKEEAEKKKEEAAKKETNATAPAATEDQKDKPVAAPAASPAPAP